MQLVVHTNEFLKQELLSGGTTRQVEMIYVTTVEEFKKYKNAHGYLDLLFDNTEQRIDLLKTLLPKPIIINSVIVTLEKVNAPFVRINGWPGFLKRSVVEASGNDESIKLQASKFFSSLNKRIEWVKDKPGFFSTKVIAMIINEAWFALEEGVSTKEEIDTAMKLGTNYPYGPFEWCQKIGIKNIYNLLDELAKENSRYRPAGLLKKEALR